MRSLQREKEAKRIQVKSFDKKKVFCSRTRSDFHPLVRFAIKFSRVMSFICYIGVDLVYLVGFVITGFRYAGLVKSRCCYAHFTVTLAGLNKIVRYIGDFIVNQESVISVIISGKLERNSP